MSQSQRRTRAHLGKPDHEIGGFQLWVHGREFPEAAGDCEDADWLRVTAHCGGSGASVWVSGSLVMLTDLAGFGGQCDALHRGAASSAALDPCEPYFRVSLAAGNRSGHVRVRVEITPDPLAQSHAMSFDVDRGRLPDIIGQCSAIVRKYPVRGRA
jgi:hypothetical protein